MSAKLVAGQVTIQPCNIGMGYFYKGECFAYVWATPLGSTHWWDGLMLFAGVSREKLSRWNGERENAARKIRKK